MSTLSALYTRSTYKIKKGKIVFEESQNYSFYFDMLTGAPAYWMYRSCSFGVVSTNLVNISSEPVFVYSVKIVKNNKIICSHFPELHVPTPNVAITSCKSFSLRPSKPAFLPIKLTAFESADVSFRFPKFNIQQDKDGFYKFTLVMNTSKGVFKKRFSIKSYLSTIKSMDFKDAIEEDLARGASLENQWEIVE